MAVSPMTLSCLTANAKQAEQELQEGSAAAGNLYEDAHDGSMIAGRADRQD